MPQPRRDGQCNLSAARTYHPMIDSQIGIREVIGICPGQAGAPTRARGRRSTA
jgi:hypothetical protein